MPVKGKRILLLDGTGLAYRAHFAFIARPLTTTRGENTSALFGFLRVLFQIIRDLHPDMIITAFDISRKTFRQKIYPDYKAHREETPPDLKQQIPLIIDTLKIMHLPALELEDYEADDIIGTVSERLKNDNEVFIVSGDKDLLQLVGGNVKVIRPQHGISEVALMGREEVKKSLGIYPEQIPDYLALLGDSSDNIPGVKGIGEKSAVSLLSVYKSIEDIYDNLEAIKGAQGLKLSAGKDNAFLSKKLALLKLDLPITIELYNYNLEVDKFLSPELVRVLEHYQLTSLIQEIKKLASPGKEVTADSDLRGPESRAETGYLTGNYKLVLKKEELLSLTAEIRRLQFVSIDTETTSRNPNNADIIGISISLEEGSGYFIPLLYPAGQEFDVAFAVNTLKPVLEEGSVKKIGQNIKYDIEVLSRAGIQIHGTSFDTMIAAYLLNPVRTHNNLESLVYEYLGQKKVEYTEMLKNIAKKDKTLLDIEIADLVHYACADADSALRLSNKLSPLISTNKLDYVFHDIEIPLINVLAEMEMAGVKIDTVKLKELSVLLDGSMKKLEENIYRLAGHEFNINSPPQLGKVLFEEIGLGTVKKTTGGKSSTDEEVLSYLAAVHPLPAEILKYRTFSKLKGTYIDALPELILGKTGRIHTSFNQTITATGRLSSSDPNLQNIPVRDEIGKEIRKAFIADQGNVIISADYSQIELRLLAHYCMDEQMLKAFKDNLDIHTHTASLIFGIDEKHVTEEMRRKAKSVNFGIIYGLQSYGLSKQIGVPLSEAREFIGNYFKTFPGVKNFVENILLEAKETGEVRTLSGRYRRFPELVGKEIKKDYLNASQRMALNTKLQGGAADVIKIAMINLGEYLRSNKSEARLILQIHDELVIEAPEKEALNLKVALKGIMEKAYVLNVPLIAEVGIGKNWGDAH